MIRQLVVACAMEAWESVLALRQRVRPAGIPRGTVGRSRAARIASAEHSISILQQGSTGRTQMMLFHPIINSPRPELRRCWSLMVKTVWTVANRSVLRIARNGWCMAPVCSSAPNMQYLRLGETCMSELQPACQHSSAAQTPTRAGLLRVTICLITSWTTVHMY